MGPGEIPLSAILTELGREPVLLRLAARRLVASLLKLPPRMNVVWSEEAAYALVALETKLAERYSAEKAAQIVGEHPGSVLLRTRFGSRRLLDLLSGDQLPRIC